MHKPTPAHIVTSVAIALSSTAALAQLQIQPVGPRTSSTAADAPFRTTLNTPDATSTGAALGQSPGQTSSGTAAGNSSPGIGGRSANLGTVNPSGGDTVVPGERIATGNGSAGVAANAATTPTPIFELTARQGAAREARRRARGEEPRIYGIAPRTDRDLTHQMPDDPIIRY